MYYYSVALPSINNLISCISEVHRNLKLSGRISDRPYAGSATKKFNELVNLAINIKITKDDVLDDVLVDNIVSFSELSELIRQKGLHDNSVEQIEANRKILDFIYNKTIKPNNKNVLYLDDMIPNKTWLKYFEIDSTVDDQDSILHYDTIDRLKDTLSNYISSIQQGGRARYSRQYYISIWDKATDEVLAQTGLSILPSLLGMHIQICKLDEYYDYLVLTVHTRSTDIKFLGNDLYFFIRLFNFISDRCNCGLGSIGYNIANLHELVD